MASEQGDETAFRLGADFVAGEISGGLGFGPLEVQYEELLAEVLEDGVITSDERARLEKAADNLGLDRQKLLALEQAMVAAYQSHHKVKIVEHFEEPAASLAPIDLGAAGDAGHQMLLTQIEQLKARIKELEEELVRAQSHMNVEIDLSEMEATAEAATEDPLDVWRRVRRDPSALEPLRNLYRIYGARADIDKQWCVSQALVVLGAASPQEAATFEKHRSPGLISPTGSLTSDAWHSWLFHPEQEPLTGQIFSIITPATLVGRVSALRRSKSLHIPTPGSEADMAKATLTAVRALGWGATLLGLALPTVHLEKDRDTGFEHIPGVPPLSVVGRRVLSGLGQAEHAFLAGRHLAWYRQESYIRTLFSAIADLEDLFMAALTIGNPGLPISADKKERVAPVARAIEPMLNPAQVDALRGCFLRFVEEGGRTNLQRFASATEKTACRAGLLLSNDLSVAAKVLEKEEGKLGERLKDLIVFVTGESYFELRKHLGIQLV